MGTGFTFGGLGTRRCIASEAPDDTLGSEGPTAGLDPRDLSDPQGAGLGQLRGALPPPPLLVAEHLFLDVRFVLAAGVPAGTAEGGGQGGPLAILPGGSGNDSLIGGVENDSITGGDGNDYLNGAPGNDILRGDAGDDTLYGDADNDVLHGGDGKDSLDGGWGSDQLSGGIGNDALRGGYGNDNLYGDDGHDSLHGDDDHDTLDGGLGNDTLFGGIGNDTLVGRDSDSLAGDEGNDILVGYANASLRGGTGNDGLTVFGGIADGEGGNDVLFGEGQNITLKGGTGDDTLFGSSGAETLDGGDGNDHLYAEGPGDVLTGGAGIDTLHPGQDSSGALVVTLGSGTYSLGGLVSSMTGVENIDGSALADVLTGEVGVTNVLQGAAGNDTLRGDRDDTLRGGEGDDLIVNTALNRGVFDGEGGSDTIDFSADPFGVGGVIDLALASFTTSLLGTYSNFENVVGSVLAEDIRGNALANRLLGGQGDAVDTLTGGEGDDTLAGGGGNDSLLGGIGDDSLQGEAGADHLSGDIGRDTLIGGSGNDTYLVDSPGDVLTETGTAITEVDSVMSPVAWTLGSNLERLTLVGSGSINGTGNSLANTINGNAGNNSLTGAAGNDTLLGDGGNDTLAGGTGNDHYTVDSAGDLISETTTTATEIDHVASSLNWTLGSNLETLTLLGSGAINGTGNGLANTITGNAANNVIDGGAGSDTMVGGAGNDSYVVDNTGDRTTEASGGGTADSVVSSVTHTLAAEVEKLSLSGSAAINGTGNDLANTITGNGANNAIDGGAGNDTMIGGAGNDSYAVGSTGDVVTELSSGGVADLVNASITHTLAAEVEQLTLVGSAAINGTGNGLANTITGNGVGNLIDGGAGNDTMIGGAGNDSYKVDSPGDSITELAGGGTADSVSATTSHTLAAEVENLALAGSGAIHGTGNTLANILTGNTAANNLAGGDGNDTLNGGAGNDSMTGGAGNDSYTVDTESDKTIEVTGGGSADQVVAGISWTLAAELEVLTLTGTEAANGTGNGLSNRLTGNTAANSLSGGAGNDSLYGGAGNDLLAGGAGNNRLEGGEGDDRYVFSDADNGTTSLLDSGGSGDVFQTQNTGRGRYTEYYRSGSSLVMKDYDELVTGALLSTTTVQNYGSSGHVEFLELMDIPTNRTTTFSLATAGAGGAGNDMVFGTVDNDTLTGVAGNDVIWGAAGNDSLDGGTGNDDIKAGAGNDVLNGGTGADSLLGQGGNDVYVVDDLADRVDERMAYGLKPDNDAGGFDTVKASLAWTLGAFVEALTLTGTAVINGTGNALANTITGNAGANTLSGADGNDTLNGGDGSDRLDGGNGNDSMIGGAGNDSYTVQGSGDRTIESIGGGTADSVSASIGWTLAAEVEKLTLTGSSLINGSGNALANTITGNSAANTLAGGDGNDTLSGGDGNDVLDGGNGNDSLTGGKGSDSYVVNGPGDVVNEASTLATEIDSVASGVGWTLGNYLERLTLTGSATINGVGNGLANTMVGNTGNNLLDGGSGNDTLDGAAGNDMLIGGTGLDIHRFSSALNGSSNVDTIKDFIAAYDAIQLENSVFLKLSTLGVLNPSFFRASSNGAAADSNDHINYETDTGKLFYDLDGNGAGVAVLFATLAGAPVIGSVDFFVT